MKQFIKINYPNAQMNQERRTTLKMQYKNTTIY